MNFPDTDPGSEGCVPRRLSVCLINPRFEPSYFGMEHALPLMPGDKRCWNVTGALPALAALAPPYCDVTLLDENVEDIDFDSLARYDIVGVTGMIVQRRRMHEILARLRDVPATVVVGGPYCSVSDAEFADLCDTRFVGEAEETWPAFLSAFARGEPVARRYAQAEKSDMQKVPAPDYRRLKSSAYITASLQSSRGCPFMCEFCDIITVFGRKPRYKTPSQMVSELDTILASGMRVCFLVDDNFIGNKRFAKDLLVAIAEWQRDHNYPVIISTEASIDLADEPELLELMLQANFRKVFIGVESPRPGSLQETRKIQNLRGDGQLEKLQRIRDSGLVVQAGFIVGFDNDDAAIFDEQYEFIMRSGIAQAIVAILSPIPTTPLYDRLRAEGRLDFSNPRVTFHPKKMTREELIEGYDRLIRRLYEPRAYLQRLLDGYAGSPSFREARRSFETQTGQIPGARQRWLALAGGLGMAARLSMAMARQGALFRVGAEYLRQWRRNRRENGVEAIPLAAFIRVCCEHWHFYRVANSTRKYEFGAMVAETEESVETGVAHYLPGQARRRAS